MSESEDDLFNTNVLNYPKESTTFSVKGPNINISSMNIKNSMCNPGMPANFNRTRYAESCIDQRTNKRDISPISMRSAFDLPRNYSYHNSMNYQRPMFNGKAGSSISVRSIESISSTSATEIALAFRKAEIALMYKNAEFNSNDLKLIKDAYQKFMKKSMRRKISKKSNFKAFERHCRNDSQDLSGDLTNISSSSSSDDKSPRKDLHKKKNALGCRSTKSGFTFARSIIKPNNISKENPENTQASTFGDISSIPPVNAQIAQKLQNIPVMPKDRFKKGYALPIQRFNHSTIQENNENLIHNNNSITQNESAVVINTNDNEQDIVSNIFTNKTVSGLKRNRDEDIKLPQPKKRKTSPISKTSNVPTSKANDFAFVKPKFPVRKSAHAKNSGEGLISSTLLGSNTLNIENSPKIIIHNNEERKKEACVKDNETNNDQLKENEISEIDKNISDVSGKPSFIKRKLFTQKLEVTEKRNLSIDNIQSPQTGHTVWQKDKTKPRKLTTAQLCLTRDIDSEDNNLYDLISKIVPTDHINKQDTLLKKSTENVKNKKTTNIRKSKKKKSNSCEEDWDIISVVSTCNQDSISETYTDDEVFEQYKSNTTVNNENKKLQSEKLTTKNTTPEYKLTKQIVVPLKNLSEKIAQNNAAKKTPLLTFKSFWDTDLDTDIESMTPKKTFNNIEKDASQKELTSNKVSGSGNGLKSVQNKEIQIILQKTDKHLITELHKNHSFNLRERVDRNRTNSCCNEINTPNLQRNQNNTRLLTKTNISNKESISKNKENNTDKLTSLDDSHNNYNEKRVKSNKMTTCSSGFESKSKNATTLIRKQKNITISKSMTKTGTTDKCSKTNRILLTPKKNAPKVHNDNLSDSNLSNGFDVSKCLRSRVVNVSNDSVKDNCSKKVTPVKRKANNDLQRSIISFCIKSDSNKNGKSVRNHLSKKPNSPVQTRRSRDKMLFNTSVQTRRSRALSAHKTLK